MYCMLGARTPLKKFDFEGDLKWPPLRLGALTPTGMKQVRETSVKQVCPCEGSPTRYMHSVEILMNVQGAQNMHTRCPGS